MDFPTIIRENNATHTVDATELTSLIEEAKALHVKHHGKETFFERSVFINWTCGIADCKYCYLSTQPKSDKQALRSPASILAEILVCKAMGWRIGYLTGGLRVESSEYMTNLLENVEKVLGHKTWMNFGPYTHKEVQSFKPYVGGMGSAIESFDEELHNYICPSKPLKALKRFLGYLQEEEMGKLITIILGIGEKKSDLDEVIKEIEHYGIDTVQLCFLKPQENTVFAEVPAPDPEYMCWWIAKLRIAFPKLKIKIALVRERMGDTQRYLEAGANGFSRFMVFKDFNSSYAKELEAGCIAAGRELEGHFTTLPEFDVDAAVDKLDLEEKLKEVVRLKAKQYWKKLEKLEKKGQTLLL
jgi:biotin synthase-like enzyme